MTNKGTHPKFSSQGLPFKPADTDCLAMEREMPAPLCPWPRTGPCLTGLLLSLLTSHYGSAWASGFWGSTQLLHHRPRLMGALQVISCSNGPEQHLSPPSLDLRTHKCVYAPCIYLMHTLECIYTISTHTPRKHVHTHIHTMHTTYLHMHQCLHTPHTYTYHV